VAGKVFGIGLNKTGTRSIASALRQLGYRTLHKGDVATSALVERAASERRPLLTYLGSSWDAYFDVAALVHGFRDLDAQYPGSRFLLSTRELEGWLRSREKHVLANQRRAAEGAYSGRWLTVDIDGWRTEWQAHHAAVAEYFGDRPDDLLVFDAVGGDGWDVLCPFLGASVPRGRFPWENKDGAGTYAGSSRRSEILRLMHSAEGRARRMLQRHG
jgi:hypothetical protein